MLFAFAGLCFGLVVATIGAWKDSRWEPFRWSSFWRSPVLGVFWSLVLSVPFHRQPVFLVALAAMSLERVSVELWKGCLRRRPSKFNHPDRDTGWISKANRRPPAT